MANNKESLVRIIDFWRKSVEQDDLRDRLITGEINLKSKEIIDLVGPRRSGKSSIFKLIIKKLNLKDNYLYINFEDPFFIGNNSPQIIESLVEVFREYFNPGLEYVFFDEIQEIDHWEKAVRKLRDGESLNIFITGSSSKLLSGEISSLITGRHLSYKVFPLSFAEFVDFGGINLSDKKELVLKEEKLRKKFSDYLEVGGFPEVVITKNEALLKDYFYDILQKDIIKRHDVRDKDALEKMALFVLSNSGKILTMESLKRDYGLSFETASAYWEYLKESFLVFELPQFSYSLKKQGKALKKVYAVDNGLANSVSFRFSQDLGRKFETAVFLQLKQKREEIFYYKNKKGGEVDFLTRKRGANEELIQACFDLGDAKTKEREVKNLLEAMEELKINEGRIVTGGESGKIVSQGRKIIITPAFRWLLDKD